MKQYQDILRSILETGDWKENRTGTRTLAKAGVFFEHDMANGFPLLTARKMPIKSIAVELEGFIKGITSKKWYQERGCHFWDQWANPLVVDSRYKAELQERKMQNWDMLEYRGISSEDLAAKHPEVNKRALALELDDLGPLGYSYQLRRFNQVYDEDDDGTTQQCDQLRSIVKTLKSDPNDRRMVATLWNPLQTSKMALPACTVAWMVTVIGNRLNLSWFQRSCDFVLGAPSDIASMAMMQELLALEANLDAGRLTGLLVDCHVYENHIPAARELLSREPRELPGLNLILKSDIFEWTHKDFALSNYNPHPALQMGAIAV